MKVYMGFALVLMALAGTIRGVQSHLALVGPPQKQQPKNLESRTKICSALPAFLLGRYGQQRARANPLTLRIVASSFLLRGHT